MSKIVLTAVLLAAASASAARAADAPAPAKAADTTLGGPLVKGVCLLSQDAVLANAKAAKAIEARLGQLKDQAQAEVNTARAPVDADLKALQADAARTPAPPAADIEARRVVIQARYQTLQELADQRNREIDATRTKALGRLSAEMQPILAGAYKAHGCGLLFNRNAVLAGNMGADLTAEVVKGLDAKIITLSFDREILPPPKK
jgi:Skp family chaperone for outer membrane proteins